MSLGVTQCIPESFSLLSSIFCSLSCSRIGGFVFQVGTDLVEESMQMIGGLQLVARTQSSQYVLNEVNWV